MALLGFIAKDARIGGELAIFEIKNRNIDSVEVARKIRGAGEKQNIGIEIKHRAIYGKRHEDAPSDK